MTSIARRIELLNCEPPPVVAGVLAQSLPHANPDERVAICRRLVASGHEIGVAAVIQTLHTLGPDGIELLTDGSLHVSRAVRRALTDRSAATAANVIAVIRKRNESALIDVLVDQLGSPHDEIPAQAASALLSICIRCAGASGRRTLTDQVSTRLDNALARALKGYASHRQIDVLAATALVASRRLPHVESVLVDKDDPPPFGFGRVVDHADESLVARNLIRWLGTPHLMRAVQNRLHSWLRERRNGGFHRDVHLLFTPARRRAVRGLDRPLLCVPTMDAAVRLDEPGQAALADFIRVLDLTTSRKIERLAELVALPSPLGRLNALRALLRYDNDLARRAIEPFCFDDCPAVARLASAGLLTGGSRPDPDLLHRLSRSPHPSVRQAALRRIASTSAAEFFRLWSSLPWPVLVGIARQMINRDLKSFIRGIRDVLQSPDEVDNGRAIRLIRRLGITIAMEPELLRHANSTNPRLASTAVAALGECTGVAGRELLRVTLRHADARVRANAVEALAGTDERGAIELIRPMYGAVDNRSRGNALLAGLRAGEPTALTHLATMLADPRPAHRRTALWVAQRAGTLHIRPLTDKMAEDDPVPEVRCRARAVARVLGTAQRPKSRYTPVSRANADLIANIDSSLTAGSS